MAVRSKMSTARSRGRAVVKTTSDGENKPKEYSNVGRAATKQGVDYSIANITPEDEKLLRKQLRLSDSEDFVVTSADYNVWQKTGKKDPTQYSEDWAKGKPNPFQENYEGDVFGNAIMPQIYPKGKAPKPKPQPVTKPTQKEFKEAADKVKPLDKLSTLKGSEKSSGKNIEIKKAANKDLLVPEGIKEPGYRTVKRKKLVVQKTRSAKNMFGKQRSGGKIKPKLEISKITIDKQKNPRVSERIKFAKEEKLAGGREKALGLTGVATEKESILYGKNAYKKEKNISGAKTIEKGSKYKGSAQRLKDIKNILGSKTDAITSDANLNIPSNYADRKSTLKEAKKDIRSVAKLGRQYKSDSKMATTKGKAKAAVKSLKEEYKSAKKPVKFSKGTSTDLLKQDIASMSRKAKTPAELKEMKANIKKSSKTARTIKNTAADKESRKINIGISKNLVKEARTYKGDIKKGLRMERMDTRARKSADRASEGKELKKSLKGRTMRGTGYFSMSELNKTTPLKNTTYNSTQAGTKRYKN